MVHGGLFQGWGWAGAERASLLPATFQGQLYQTWLTPGGIGSLTPGILGVGAVGAAGAAGGAAVVNQMLDQCPATRPCQVLFHPIC